jgi:hypothetical protein
VWQEPKREVRLCPLVSEAKLLRRQLQLDGGEARRCGMNAEQRALKRFETEFGKDLANVKFFVRSTRVSATDLYEEINRFEDTVVDGVVEVVESIDRDFPTKRFDAPFE